MNKKIFYMLVIVAILIILSLVMVLVRGNRSSSKIQIKGENGQTVTTKDFTQNSVKNDQSAQTLQDDKSSAVIMFNGDSNIFTILVHASEEQEFNQKRILAEEQFLAELGISEAEACKLNVEVATDGPETDLLPFSKPQPLSFCK